MSQKTASILVPNYNSFQAIQLCLESIRAYDAGWPYRIIVHDDYPANGIDAPYLAHALETGLIDELYTSPIAQGHGGSLNILVNEKCQTDYAAIFDCDTSVWADGWLRNLIDAAERDPKAMIVADIAPGGYQFWHGGYRTAFFLTCFCLLNMNAYRDRMQVDWRLSYEDRRKEPYTSMFAPLYPPESKAQFMGWWNEKNSDGSRRHFVACTTLEEFPRDLVVNDPGSQLYVKLISDNPKDYRAAPLPETVNKKWHHFGHISMLATPHEGESDANKRERAARFALIRYELEWIRGGK